MVYCSAVFLGLPAILPGTKCRGNVYTALHVSRFAEQFISNSRQNVIYSKYLLKSEWRVSLLLCGVSRFAWVACHIAGNEVPRECVHGAPCFSVCRAIHLRYPPECDLFQILAKIRVEELVYCSVVFLGLSGLTAIFLGL